MSWTKPEGRIYPIEGAGRFWSVTTLLGIIDKSNALMYWAVNNAIRLFLEEVIKGQSLDPSWLARIADMAKKEFRRVRDEAAEIGSQVHALAEGFCYALMDGRDYTIPDNLDPRVANAFGLFTEWARMVELEPLKIETRVHHTTYRYARRLDMIARGFFDRTPESPKGKWRKKRTYTIDTKTSKAIYETFGPQIAAYTEGYKFCEPKGLQIDGEGIIRVGKEDGVPEFHDCTDQHEINYKRFLAITEAYYLWKGMPK